MNQYVTITENDSRKLPFGKKYSDFFRKEKNKKRITSHKMALNTMLFIDSLSFITYEIYGDSGYESDTVRIEGDNHYSAGSQHAIQNATAADKNWSKSEKEIVLAIGYDIMHNGPIRKLMDKYGINGVGTYYETGHGYTFCHFDSRAGKFTYFQAIPKSVAEKAKNAHDSFLQKVKRKPKVLLLLENNTNIDTQAIDVTENIAGDNMEDPLSLTEWIGFYSLKAFLGILTAGFVYFLYKNYLKQDKNNIY